MNKRRSEGPFTRAHLVLDGWLADDARVGEDGLCHTSSTGAKGERVEDDALCSAPKKMTKIVSLQNVGTFFDASYKQAIRQPNDNL